MTPGGSGEPLFGGILRIVIGEGIFYEENFEFRVQFQKVSHKKNGHAIVLIKIVLHRIIIIFYVFSIRPIWSSHQPYIPSCCRLC